MLSSLPGIFVEEFPDEHLTDDCLAVKVAQKSNSAKSASGYSTPGLSDLSAAGTPRGGALSTGTPVVIKPVNGVLIPFSPQFNTSLASTASPVSILVPVTKAESPGIEQPLAIAPSGVEAGEVVKERPQMDSMAQGKEYK